MSPHGIDIALVPNSKTVNVQPQGTPTPKCSVRAKPKCLAIRPRRARRRLRPRIKNLPLRISRQPRSASLRNRLPLFPRLQNSLEHRIPRRLSPNKSRIIPPQPPHRLRKQLRSLAAIVAARAPHMTHVVPGKLQCAVHRKVRHPPIAHFRASGPFIMHPILHEDAHRFRLGLAHQNVVLLPAAHTDIGANGAEHAPKSIWTFPCNSESSDGPSAATADSPIIRITGKRENTPTHRRLPFDGRHHLFKDKTRQPITSAIEFETAIEAWILRSLSGLHNPRRNANADRDRHRVLRDEVVENRRSLKSQAVKPHVNTRRFVPLISRGNVDRDGPHGTRKNLGVRKLERQNLSRHNARMGL